MEKKTYIIPTITTVAVNVKSQILEGSMHMSSSITVEDEDGGWVKADRNSRSNYNVWDDDWSN